jgi:hypothetical protein
LTTGNTGTTIATNYIGTNDNNTFGVRTNLIERMRVWNTGEGLFNGTTYFAGDVFAVYGTGSLLQTSNLGDWAINGYVGGAGAGVYGVNIGTGSGVRGEVANTAAFGVYGWNQDATSGIGVLGVSSGTTANAIGVQGQSVAVGSVGNGVAGFSVSTGTGVYGQNTAGGEGVYGFNNSTGLGVFGVNTSTGVGVYGFATTTGDGTVGQASNGAGFGVWGINTAATGTGVAGAGNNRVTVYMPGGSGGAFTGADYGVFGFARNPTTGTAGPNAGGYFRDSISAVTNVYAYVAGYNGGTAYKILGTGTVSTIVPDAAGNQRIMYAPEAPEVLFEDYGTGQLVNGQAFINLDPVFAMNVKIDDQHPMKVFIQLEGECNGVYVDLKSADGFRVTELNNGRSNVNFSWHVVCNRADSKVNGVTTSLYEDVRLPEFKGSETNSRPVPTSVQVKEKAQPAPTPAEKPNSPLNNSAPSGVKPR